MKKHDFIFLVLIIILFSPFFIFTQVYEFYKDFNHNHGMIMSFIKFAILATIGESIGLRIKTNKYNYKGFGLLPRAIVWGFLGMFIKVAFIVFAAGMPVFAEFIGIEDAVKAFQSTPVTSSKLIVSFFIGTGLNIMFAPVFMVLHKVTDSHIVENGGTLTGFLKPIDFGKHLQEIDWKIQWNFVFKKTIPLFWIPAQTGVFLLPAEHRILAAALLSIVLGVIMAVASQMQKK